jgi:ribosomal protein S27E
VGVSGKGDKRRPLKVSREQLASNWDRIFSRIAAAPVECPRCKEIELRPTGVDNMRECSSCGHTEQI